MNKKNFFKCFLKWFPVLKWFINLLAVIAIFCIYDKTNKELSNAKLKLETKLLPLDHKNNIRLTLYNEVKNAISQKDTILHNATYFIVDEMLAEDSVFQINLKNILRSVSSSPTQTQKKIDNFREEQNLLTTIDKFTIDVFYLEDILEEAELQAEAVCLRLRSKYPEYLIRKRLLPKIINAKIGYQIDFNQIRYDVGSKEEQLAREILNEIQKYNIFSNEQPVLKGINQKGKTENYISIFIRNM